MVITVCDCCKKEGVKYTFQFKVQDKVLEDLTGLIVPDMADKAGHVCDCCYQDILRFFNGGSNN